VVPVPAQFLILRDIQQQFVDAVRARKFASADDLLRGHLFVRGHCQRASQRWQYYLSFILLAFTLHVICMIGEQPLPSDCRLLCLS
jgi:hypothetical protein